ncbi:MAG: hypothetical protein RLZ92_98 [Pseudomonadota bacterium]
MHITQHARARMTQRGITLEMIDLVLEYGEVNQDKTYLDRKGAEQVVRELEAKLKVAKQIFGKSARAKQDLVKKDVYFGYNSTARH